jgi:hypothetical protein
LIAQAKTLRRHGITIIIHSLHTNQSGGLNKTLLPAENFTPAEYVGIIRVWLAAMLDTQQTSCWNASNC